MPNAIFSPVAEHPNGFQFPLFDEKDKLASVRVDEPQDLPMLSSSGSVTPSEELAALPTTKPVIPFVTEETRAPSSTALLDLFVANHRELQKYRSGQPIVLDGYHLTLPAVAAAARELANVRLTDDQDVRDRIAKSRLVMESKLNANKSVYGVSTGFGGSADTRTGDHASLGNALLQHQHAGVLPSSIYPSKSSAQAYSYESATSCSVPLPLNDPTTALAMPPSWTRAALLIRTNSLIRGHSGVRFSLISKMTDMLNANITPIVPMRGSISASGDLSPLSYIAGCVMGNEEILCYVNQEVEGVMGQKEMRRVIKRSPEALKAANIEPLTLLPKEHLGILNGTAFSCALTALTLSQSISLTILTSTLTAMGVEALLGTAGSFDPFIHDVCRPHPGQVEVAATVRWLLHGQRESAGVLARDIDGEGEECNIADDSGHLRQDRYPLRTSPQWTGPGVESVLNAVKVVERECNSTTDNPLLSPSTATIHHGGNFQALSLTVVSDPLRLTLFHHAKLLFSQLTELLNPTMNRGLPPSLAGSGTPSVDFHCKGIDIACASYTSEMGWLANPVGGFVQSAEMHNQAVNSLALISARQTSQSIDVLSMLAASYLYALCQALDLRALQHYFAEEMKVILHEELNKVFGDALSATDLQKLNATLVPVLGHSMDETGTMDVEARMVKVAASVSAPVLDFFTMLSESESHSSGASPSLSSITDLRKSLASRFAVSHKRLTVAILGAEAPFGAAPAAPFMGRTRALYEFVRLTLGVRMHGKENLERFAEGHGLGQSDKTVGGNISKIYEAIRDGVVDGVLVSMFEGKDKEDL